MPEQREPASATADVRRAYETEGVYSVSTICRKMHDGARDYVDELLVDKLETVRRHLQPGLVVDLCCATGQYLLAIADAVDEGLGIDFSEPYIAKATTDVAASGVGHVSFLVGDATAMPLQTESVGTLFSFSSLYAIPDVGRVVAEIARVLRPGGRAILDFGNSRSINTICVRQYTDWPKTHPIPVDEMLRLMRQNNLVVVERRAFQILPLWAGRPIWLWPLLRPGWKRIMRKRIRGRMIDEWISSWAPIRQFAFRHLLVVERPEKN